jgi:hypothetical protein
MSTLLNFFVAQSSLNTKQDIFLHTSMQYSFWLLIRWFRISVLVKDTVYDLKHMTTLSILSNAQSWITLLGYSCQR